MSEVLYAVGDIHGSLNLLKTLKSHIRDFHQLMFPGRAARVIYLGDYVDYGDQSLAVLDDLIAGDSGFASVCLMGNHEAMLLECLDSADPAHWQNWLDNGGRKTCSSLGLAAGTDPDGLARALGSDRIGWLRALPLTYQAGSYLFVHAGIRPGVPLGQQSQRDQLWIRSQFLESDADHGVVVIHGHTPTDTPDIHHNRIGIDTGAYRTEVLTAAVLDGQAKPLFLRTS